MEGSPNKLKKLQRRAPTESEVVEKLHLRGIPEAIFVPDSGVVRKPINKLDKKGHIVGVRYVWDAPNFKDDTAISAKPAEYTIGFTPQHQPMVGASGGKARDIAAAKLAGVFKKAIVVPMSRFEVPNQTEADKKLGVPVDHYEINARIIEKRNVEHDRIVPETESTTIFEGIVQMLRMCRERGLTHACFVTNDYNVPRAQAMLEALLNAEHGVQEQLAYTIACLNQKYLDILGAEVDNSGQTPRITINAEKYRSAFGNIHVDIVTAEEALLIFNKERMGKVLAARSGNQIFENRLAQEQSGAQQIAEGTYMKAAWEKKFGKT